MEICSICQKNKRKVYEFDTLEEYLNHKCVTGFKPIQIEHAIKLDPNYKKISESALARGKANS